MTIGYGHLIGGSENFSNITKFEALDILARDLQEAEERVKQCSEKYGVVWDQNQFDALVSLSFNSGYNVSYVIEDLVNGDDPYAAFSTIIKANGEKSLGLYRRRMDEADTFVLGTYERTYREW